MSIHGETTKSLDERNSEFWNELCGSFHAKMLGITDRSPASLRKFDDWYFGYYPYLTKHIPFGAMNGKRVLEVGLGYGTVSQRIAESGARLSAMDIAAGPVEMVDYRLKQLGVEGETVEGSVLNAPFPDATFDHAVAIGCYHHTGDTQRAIDETWRVLKPGGTMSIMLYNALSYRRWLDNPSVIGRSLVRGYLPFEFSAQISEAEKAVYDANAAGDAAPHIEFVSRRKLKLMCRRFSSFRADLENITLEPRPEQMTFAQKSIARLLRGVGADIYNVPREILLTTRWPRYLGLDIYATAVK